MLSIAAVTLVLALSHHRDTLEDDLRLSRIQEEQNLRVEENRRREQVLRDQAAREVQEREDRERRQLDERARENRIREEQAEEIRFQRDQDRRRREEIRNAELEWQRDEDERVLAARRRQAAHLNEQFHNGEPQPFDRSPVRVNNAPRPPPAQQTGPKPTPPVEKTQPVFEI